LGEFEQFQPLTVGRELTMIELMKIELLRKMGSGQPKRSR
jgi:hypothetical protein